MDRPAKRARLGSRRASSPRRGRIYSSGGTSRAPWRAADDVSPSATFGWGRDVESMARRLSVLRDAVTVVLRRLAVLPPSAEVEELKAKAEECVKEAKGWSRSPPAPEERDRVSKRLLKLHAEVAKLERSGPGS